MNKFDLPAESRLKVTKVTPRKEIHGEDLVQAISLRLRWETTNDNLELLHPNLKAMLFWKTPAVEAQERLEGIPEVTPNLRVPIAALPIKLELSYAGYSIVIDHGIDASSALELYVCGLDKFAVDAKEGGTAIIDFSLGSNKEVTPELVGEICALEGTEIVATLTPPAIAVGPVIDGSAQAFERDHPGGDGRQADLLGEEHDDRGATDAFLGIHGNLSGDDQGDDDGIERGEGWPFPQTDENGDPVRGDADQAAAAAQPPASRRGRRTQREAH